jgi:hypothetical protein
MTLTLHITPDLEHELQRRAAQAGLAPSAYAERLLQNGLRALARPEAELLQRINQSLTPEAWQRYEVLLAHRQAETLTPEEQTELIALSDQLEAFNAQRLEALTEMAQLRGVPVPALMAQLGLTPRARTR